MELKRELNPKLKAWFDARLLHPTPLPFEHPHNPTKMLLLTALICQNIVETQGDNHGTMVEWFQDTIGQPKGEPWCLSFVQSCIAYVETFGFDSGVYPTEHCLTAWGKSACVKSQTPIAGDIVIYRYGDTQNGHCGIVRAVSAASIDTIEGNTGPSGGFIDRNGDGVYLKSRLKGGIGKMHQVGFLRPFSVAK